MTRQQTQSIALSVLAVVLVAVYVRACAPKRSAPGAAVPSATVPVQPPAEVPSGPAALAPQEVLAQREAQRLRASELNWNRDPFTRGRTGAVGGFTLSGILWDTQQPIAIINGQMLQVGEELDGYRVADIGQDHVSLTDGTHTYQLLIAP